MYKKESEGWLKHWDFILLDMLCLQVAFVLAYILRGCGFNPYSQLLYRNMAIFLELADIVIIFFGDTLKDVLKIGHYRNFIITVRHAMLVAGFAILYLFLLQEGQNYSRLTLGIMLVVYTVITYSVREWRKYKLKKQMRDGSERSLLIISTKDIAHEVIENIRANNYARYILAGIAIIDDDGNTSDIEGVQVVANEKTAPEFICQEWIDEVLIVIGDNRLYPSTLFEKLAETGVTIHLNLLKGTKIADKKQFVEKIGNYTVLTTSINYASGKQLLAKRIMDIFAGIVGCIITGIIFIFIGPIIYINSPGPIFFSQVRVGKNGKKFKMYKFRSMYLDAEERKKDLMEDNKIKDGKMFKLDFDPRVIGNIILADGTKKKGIGDFIRRTSLDEFPQFYNVLKGEMSLIGTRPPTVDEWDKYELHHRARLAIKPGITGMWQVSGRSEITDFEEVVNLDMKYITQWSIGMDLKILLKTIVSVLKKDGAK